MTHTSTIQTSLRARARSFVRMKDSSVTTVVCDMRNMFAYPIGVVHLRKSCLPHEKHNRMHKFEIHVKQGRLVHVLYETCFVYALE